MLLQSETVIPKWDKKQLSKINYKMWQRFITKCVRYYKVRRSSLQSASGITICGRLSLQGASGITNCDIYYEVRCNTSPSFSIIYIAIKDKVNCNIYFFKVHNRNTRKRCEICSKLTVKTPERHHWGRSGAFIVNFEHIPHLFLVFLLLTLNK